MMRPRLPETPFTTAEALALGFTRNELSSLVTTQVLRRPFSGVYLRADLPDTVETRAQAAGRVMSPHSVLCDRTAAWFHGVDVFRYAELETVPALESFVLRGHDPTYRRECHGGTRDLVPEDWEWVAGVRVTTPLRTAVDLACSLRRREALAALDALARERGVTIAAMNWLLRRYRRRRGVIQARELVQLTDPRSESSGESWTRLEIHDHGLPAPRSQFWVVVDGVPTYRLDLAYPHARIAVEYDGEEFHTDAADRAADAARRAWLEAHGWHVIVLTKHSFTAEALREWTAELSTVLRARGVQLR